jgi:hypothetical protein
MKYTLCIESLIRYPRVYDMLNVNIYRRPKNQAPKSSEPGMKSRVYAIEDPVHGWILNLPT